MENEKIVIVDRYSATGTPYPDPETMCLGKCDGMGCYPIQASELNAEAVKSPTGRLTVIGQTSAPGVPMEPDDWLIVECPDCLGTRKRNLTPTSVNERSAKA